ncbi:hypothetical protein NDJ22_19895 [Vibrio alginolyticus]|uniref:hypothetical protein n=1 Tax=Vibrio alginolyticus TaxID=663 RepID=UPI00216093BE|nr:hypothetical protein [Vibrio alginolyticus]MCS0267280.1 hypothetical protein [Vibrio alginolyticus]
MKSIYYIFTSVIVAMSTYAHCQQLSEPPVFEGSDINTISIDGIRLGDDIAQLIERDPNHTSNGTLKTAERNIPITISDEWSNYRDFCREQFYEGNQIDIKKLSTEQQRMLRDAFYSASKTLSQTAVPASFWYEYVGKNNWDRASVRIVYNQQNGLVTDISYNRKYLHSYKTIEELLNSRFDFNKLYNYDMHDRSIYAIGSSTKKLTKSEAGPAQHLHGKFEALSNLINNRKSEFPSDVMSIRLSESNGNTTHLQIDLSTKSNPQVAAETLKNSCINANREAVDTILGEVNEGVLKL